MPFSAREQLDAIQRIETLIANRNPLNDTIRAILFITCRSMNVPTGLGVIALYNTEGKPVMVRWEGVNNILPSVAAAPSLEQGVVGEAIRTRQYKIFNELGNPQKRPPYFIEYRPGVQSEIAMPIISRGNAIGVINIEDTRRNAYSDAEVLWAHQLAYLAATAVEVESANTLRNVDSLNPRLAQIVASAAERLQAELDIRDPESAIDNFLDSVIEIADDSLVDERADVAVLLIRLDGRQFVSSFGRERRGAQRIRDFNLQTITWSREQGLTGRAIQDRETKYLPDRRNMSSAENILTSQNWVVTEVAIPLFGKDNTEVGVLNIGLNRENALTPEQLRAIRDLMAKATLILDNLRLHETTQREASELQMIMDMGSQKLGTLTLEAAADRIVRSAADIIPAATRGYLFLRDGDDLVERAATTDHRPDNILAQKNSLEWQCIEDQEPKILQSIQDTRFKQSENDIGSRLVVYLGPENAIFGVLGISTAKNNAFTDDDQKKMILLAQVASNTLTAITQPKEQADLSRQLIEIATQLTEAAYGDLDALLGEILQAAIRLTGVPDTYCSVLWLEGDYLRLGKHTDRRERKADRMKKNEGICGLAIERKEPIYVRDYRDEEWSGRFRPITPKSGSEFVVPLRRNTQILGVLNLESPQINAFNPNMQDLIKRMASLIAQVLTVNNEYSTLTDRIDDVAHQLRHLMRDIGRSIADLDETDALADSDTLNIIKEAIGMIRININRLDGAANLLNPAKQNPQMVDVTSLVHQTARGYQYMLHRRNIELSIPEFEDQYFSLIILHELEAVIIELLTNARKHAFEHTTVTVDVQPAGPNEIYITVDSEGDAISPNDFEKMFDYGVQGSAINDGTGKGLYFCRNTIRAWGGDVFLRELPTNGPTARQGIRVVVLLKRER